MKSKLLFSTFSAVLIGTFPAFAGYVHNDPINSIDPNGQETVFIGGAGDSGAYKDDFVRALSDAGLSNVRGSTPFSMGPDAPGGFLVDSSLGVLNNNQNISPRFIYSADLDRQTNDPTFNLVGYSWGSVVAAQQAVSIAGQGGTVDNLVLLGAPINQSLVDQLTTLSDQGSIGQLHFIDLTPVGDPIHAGMTDGEILRHAPMLATQMPINAGHFYLSGANQSGAERRDAFADYLVKERGVE